MILSIIWVSAIFCGKIALVVACCLLGTCLSLIVGLVLTGIRVFSANGVACRDSTIAYNLGEDELSWADDGDLMRKLWISQLATFIPMMFCGFASIIWGNAAWNGLNGNAAWNGDPLWDADY